MAGVKLNTKGLDAAIRTLKGGGMGRLPKVRVGILASTNHRAGTGESNATIGAIHEFGNSTHPMRSFLRMPLRTRLDKQLKKSGAFDNKTFDQVIKEKSFTVYMKKVGQVAVATILKAFGTNGFGTWAPWKGTYKSRTGDILVDTAALRNSITFEVKE